MDYGSPTTTGDRHTLSWPMADPPAVASGCRSSEKFTPIQLFVLSAHCQCVWRIEDLRPSSLQGRGDKEPGPQSSDRSLSSRSADYVPRRPPFSATAPRGNVLIEEVMPDKSSRGRRTSLRAVSAHKSLHVLGRRLKTKVLVTGLEVTKRPDMPSNSVGGRESPGGFDSRPPPLRDSALTSTDARGGPHIGPEEAGAAGRERPVTHTSRRGPHKSLVVHPSSEPDKSSRGRAESWTTLRRPPARRGGPLQDPPLPSSGAEPKDEVAREDGS